MLLLTLHSIMENKPEYHLGDLSSNLSRGNFLFKNFQLFLMKNIFEINIITASSKTDAAKIINNSLLRK